MIWKSKSHPKQDPYPLKNTDSYILMTKWEEYNKIQNSHNSEMERIKGI